MRVQAGAVAVLVAVFLTACSGDDVGTASSGQVERFCGTAVSRTQLNAGSGPFYLDSSTADVSFTAHAAAGGTWVRVSGDCAHGSRVEVPRAPTVVIVQKEYTTDGADLAVLVGPSAPGDTVLRVVHADGSATTITARISAKLG